MTVVYQQLLKFPSKLPTKKGSVPSASCQHKGTFVEKVVSKRKEKLFDAKISFVPEDPGCKIFFNVHCHPCFQLAFSSPCVQIEMSLFFIRDSSYFSMVISMHYAPWVIAVEEWEIYLKSPKPFQSPRLKMTIIWIFHFLSPIIILILCRPSSVLWSGSNLLCN